MVEGNLPRELYNENNYLLGETGIYSPVPPYAGANTLSRMEPGRGYLVRMTQGRSLVYQEGTFSPAALVTPSPTLTSAITP